MKIEDWYAALNYSPEQLEVARQVLEEIRRGQDASQAMRHAPLKNGGYVAKHMLVAVYRQLVKSGEWQPDPALLSRIRMKPMRTLSGVTTVTVLTGPAPARASAFSAPPTSACPRATCRMSRERRAPSRTTSIPICRCARAWIPTPPSGHPTDKIELLILGGTFSVYPARLPGMVHPALFRRHERGRIRPRWKKPSASTRPPCTATWAW